MIIFIEDIFIKNLIIYLFTSMLISKSLCQSKKFFGLFVSAIVSGLFQTLGEIVCLGTIGSLILTFANICLIASLSIKGTSKTFVAVVLGFTYFVVIDSVRVLLTQKVKLSIFVSFLIVFVYVFLIFGMIRYFFKTKRHKKFEYKITFYEKENVFSAIAYLDSGNFLEDSLTGLPIVIIDYNVFVHLSGHGIEELLINKCHLKNSHYINYSTISGSEKMLVFDVDRVEIDGQEKKCHLGLNLKGFEKGYSALFGVNVLGESL